MGDVITFVVMPFVALLLGIGAVGGLTAATGLALHWRRRAFTILLVLISTASMGGILLSGRVLRLGEDGLENVGQSDMATGALGKVLLLAVIGCAVALCAARVFDMGRRLSADSRFQRRGVAIPSDIIFAFIAFYIGMSILPIFFGVQEYFHVKLIYPFFVYMAIFLWLPLHQDDPIKAFKLATGLIVFTSLLLAVVKPEMAIQPGYGSLIPGFNMRLWGATSHANSLGAVTCGYMLFEMAVPTRKRWLHVALLGGAFLCLILSQSKTSIISVIAAGAIIYGHRIFQYFNRKGRDYNGQGGQVLALVLGVCIVAVLALAVWTMFGDGSILKGIERKLDSRAMSGLSDGSGRTQIWAAAIDAGMQNPLFGQGADYWNVATRLRLGLSGAATAHNQYLHVFSLSGFVGVITLLIFLGFLVRYAFRGAAASGGATIAMLVVFLLRSMTETPISPNAVLASEFLSMTGIIVFIIDRGARPLAARRAAAAAAVTRLSRV